MVGFWFKLWEVRSKEGNIKNLIAASGAWDRALPSEFLGTCTLVKDGLKGASRLVAKKRT